MNYQQRNINWKYGIWEIMLIFLGITLAMWFSNWNEERKENRRFIDYMISLKADLVKDTVIFRSNIDYTERRLKSVNYLLSKLSYSKAELNKEEVIPHLNLFVWIGDLNNTYPTYEDLISTGNLRLIKNQELRRHIQDYYHQVNEYSEAIDHNNMIYMDNIVPFTMNHLTWNKIINSPGKLDVNFEKPRLDREMFSLWDLGYESKEMKRFENNLSWRNTDLNLELNHNLSLIKSAIRLIDEIEIELEAY